MTTRGLTREEQLAMKENFNKQTKKELLPLAKSLNIVGRHEMSKEVLINMIVSFTQRNEIKNQVQEQKRLKRQSRKTKKDYAPTIGQIIAFEANHHKVFSGKVVEIHDHDYVIEHKNGVKFKIEKSKVLWTKMTDKSRWPVQIYKLLKGIA